jgi:biotin transport system substrate-specific component
MAFIIGFGVEHRKAFKGAFVVALVAGTVVNYVVGVVMFCLLTHSSVMVGITACVLPFIPTAIIKAVLASIIGFAVRRAVPGIRK